MKLIKSTLILLNLLFVFISVFSLEQAKITVDLNKCLIYGPGLNANFSLAVKYFYIQLVDVYSNNITYSLGNSFFKVSLIDQETHDPIKSNVNILDQQDGVYIVRFRLYESWPSNIIIKITSSSNDNRLFYLNSSISNDCNCPENKLYNWYNQMNCNYNYSQIDLDLKQFVSIDMNLAGKLIINKYNQEYSQSLCNYVIVKNQIYRKCYGKYVDFKMFSDSILIELTKQIIKVKLPDVEFFLNLGDWPLNEKNQNIKLPIISWCGSNYSNDIVIPTYDLTESTIEMMNRQTLDVFSVRANIKTNWSQKINKAFWRGRDSRQERLNLVLMSKNYSNLIDARLTNMFFFTEKQHLNAYGPIVNRTSFYDFFKFKYQLNIDGTVAAYRFPYLIAGNSVVFKQDSIYYEHFYSDLKPFVHYIPIKHDLSDLVEKINWAINNDDKAKEISITAANYVRNNLAPNHIYCYHVKLLEAYSKLLVSPVQIRDGMQKVTIKKQNCKCSIKNLKTEF